MIYKKHIIQEHKTKGRFIWWQILECPRCKKHIYDTNVSVRGSSHFPFCKECGEDYYEWYARRNGKKYGYVIGNWVHNRRKFVKECLVIHVNKTIQNEIGVLKC